MLARPREALLLCCAPLTGGKVNDQEGPRHRVALAMGHT
jgi:hypothetical protein